MLPVDPLSLFAHGLVVGGMPRSHRCLQSAKVKSVIWWGPMLTRARKFRCLVCLGVVMCLWRNRFGNGLTVLAYSKRIVTQSPSAIRLFFRGDDE